MPSERFIQAPDGVPIWTTADGDGDLAVLLTSGGPGCCDYLAPVAELIAVPGRRVIRWDARGIGRSGGDPPGPFTIEQTLSDMEAIRCAFGIERWIVAGHSWGADLSLIYALDHPERARGLIGIAGGRLNNDREWHAAYRAGVDAGREEQPAFDYPVNLEANRQLNAAFKIYQHQPALFRRVAELQTPALFLYGSADIRPSWPVEQVAALLPNGHFVSIDGADHFCYRTHGSEIRIEIDAFLNAQHWADVDG